MPKSIVARTLILALAGLLLATACEVEPTPAPTLPRPTVTAPPVTGKTTAGGPTRTVAATTAPAATLTVAATSAPGRANPGQTYIRNMVLALATRGPSLDPLGPTYIYPPSQRQFHCVVSLQDAPPETRLQVIWYQRKVEGIAPNSMIDDAYVVIGGTTNVDFTLNSRGDWPLGDYTVELRAENQLVKAVYFSVQN